MVFMVRRGVSTLYDERLFRWASARFIFFSLLSFSFAAFSRKETSNYFVSTSARVLFGTYHESCLPPKQDGVGV